MLRTLRYFWLSLLIWVEWQRVRRLFEKEYPDGILMVDERYRHCLREYIPFPESFALWAHLNGFVETLCAVPQSVCDHFTWLVFSSQGGFDPLTPSPRPPGSRRSHHANGFSFYKKTPFRLSETGVVINRCR